MKNINRKIDNKLFDIQKVFTKKSYGYCVIKDKYQPIIDILLNNTPGFNEISFVGPEFKRNKELYENETTNNTTPPIRIL